VAKESRAIIAQARNGSLEQRDKATLLKGGRRRRDWPADAIDGTGANI